MNCLWCHQTFVETVTWQYIFGLTSEKVLCSQCEEKLIFIEGEICYKCGRPFSKIDATFRQGKMCKDCIAWMENGSVLDKNRSIYMYNEFLQEVIAKWKFRGDAQLVRIFSEPLKKLTKKVKHDVIVPVPLSEDRLYERSFNQSLLLAQQLDTKILQVLARKTTEKQSKKGRKERLSQDNTFTFIEGEEKLITGKSVLLIDDIYTTGATLNRAAVILKENGAKMVTSVTVARS